MQHRVGLPRNLGDRFSVRSAEAAGIRPDRYSSRDLHRPFRGVRSIEKPTTFQDFVDCYLPRLRPGQRFSGMTAARAWGLPVPSPWKRTEPLEIIVPWSGAAPKTAGVRGRRLREDRAATFILNGHRVIDPVAALFMIAATLTVAQAITILDALLTTSSNYPNLGPGRPLTTLDELTRRLGQWYRFPGSRTIRTALPRARELVESPKETETRLLLVDKGFPEPVVQHEVWADGEFLGRIDLAYPQWKIAIEYEGDGHRTDKEQWRKDIQRQRHLESEGWIVIRLTQTDLVASDSFVTRLRRAIASRRS